jgi:phthiocerol/phenolphthiocerol synthesis type-I polyketide synthase E
MASSAPGLSGIAVVGMACRVPGASSPAELWHNLRHGVESIRRLSEEDLIAAGLDAADIADPRHVPVGALVDGIESFDAAFFGFTAREAELLDPQHRLFLECAWQALEDAGYDAARYDGAISVFGGGIFGSYATNNLVPGGVFDDKRLTLQTVLSNEKDYMTTRVSYKLNLRGPSYTVQSGCSTSLVAIHLACESLQNFESDMALAGGVAVDVSRGQGYFHHDGSVYSADGHCRTFDANAQGTVFGNGVGIVVLKRLEDAVADGDTIHAVVLGSAINNDGSLKVGFTAPSVSGQSRVIAEALETAGVSAETIGYVEAHGTGTPLGDPIEIEATAKAFSATTHRQQYCAIGSIKSNIGHLDAAAGVTGFMKAVLALEHGEIPPSLHYEQPNPKLDLPSTPFFVADRLIPWTDGTSSGVPRRAGVSSFGMGGTNAHVVLEEAPRTAVTRDRLRPAHVFVLSARTASALDTAAEQLAQHLERHPDVALADVAHTLQSGRAVFACRRALACRSVSDAVAALRDPSRARVHHHDGERRPVAFMFPGQGAQYPGMARELYDAEPVVRDTLDECLARMSRLGVDLRPVLFPADGQVGDVSSRLSRTELAQPGLFAIEYALARLWMSWGVQPAACLGHSIGEYVAACLAGVFSLEDAITLVIERGRLMQAVPEGAMTAVPLGADVLMHDLPPALSLAAANGPSLSVIAGPTDEIEAFEHRTRQLGLECRRLHTSHAFHSAMVEPALEAFRAAVSRVRLQPPGLPFASNVTGRWITAGEATDPAYWVRHLRQTVRFADGVRTLLDGGPVHLLELGPGRALSSLARSVAGDGAASIIATLPGPSEPIGAAMTTFDALGRLWERGVQPEWTAVHAGASPRRVSLPTYPFERVRHWVDPDSGEDEKQRHRAAKRLPKPADWVYLPGWTQTTPPQLLVSPWREQPRSRWLIFVGSDPIGPSLVSQLKQLRAEDEFVTIERGARFEQTGSASWRLVPGDPAGYASVVDSFEEGLPLRVVHLWNARGMPDASGPTDGDLDDAFYGVTWLTRALAASRGGGDVHLAVVTTGAQDVFGIEPIDPVRATVFGPVTAGPQEHGRLRARWIDVDEAPSDVRARMLAHEVLSGTDPIVAHRRAGRWRPTFERVPLGEGLPAALPLRPRGVYVVTGGLGQLGAVVAWTLASVCKARLVLVGRTPMLARERWADWLASHDVAEVTSLRIARLQAIEQAGGEARVVVADVTDETALARAIAEAEQAFGRIDGVFCAAGDPGPSAFAPISTLSRPQADAQFTLKLQGLALLERVLGARRIDFCVVTSSLSAVLGGIGYTAYAAANRAMDAFVRQHNRKPGAAPWLAIDWDAVRAEDAATPTLLGALAIRPQEAAKALCYALTLGDVQQVVLSTSDLDARCWEWVGNGLRRVVEDAPPGSPARPALESAYASPETETERLVTEVWQKVLGIDGIGVHDTFLDLGGNSLTAIQVIGRLQETLGVSVAIEEFIFLTVRQLAGICDTRRPTAAAAIGTTGERPWLRLVRNAFGKAGR